jgi:1,2-diacylglycerol-3-alpha-glucose alpha-1,2-galactosyltransferase
MPREKFIVLSVGQVQTQKGVMDFIEVANHMPDIQFVWAGG